MKTTRLAVMAALGMLSAPTLALDCTQLNDWQPNQVYTGGMEVQHLTAKYTAKWWTQNQDPALYSEPENVWRKEGSCDPIGTPLPIVALDAPLDQSRHIIASPVTIKATASHPMDVPIKYVDFRVDGAVIATDDVAPYEVTWTASGLGEHTVSAEVVDEVGGRASSGNRTITVVADDVIVPPSGFKIVGYFPSWQGQVADIQFDKLTHINYSFLLPNADGSLQPLENLAKMQQLVSAAHASGVKVGIAVGGWNGGDDSAFETFASTAQGRATFIRNLMAFVELHQLDGVDMDWEYPDPGSSATNFALLMKELNVELKAKGKFLTAAVVALGYTGGGVLESVFQDVDFLNLMAYDANNADHASFQYALDSIAYWQGRGLSKEKTVLGVPFYSRPTWQAYRTLVAQDSANACRDSDGTSYYNGIPTIRAKTQLALDQAGGIMNWELSHDSQGATSLLTAKWEVAQGLAPSYQCDGTGGPDKPTQCADIQVDPSQYVAHPNWPNGDHAAADQRVRYQQAVYQANWWTRSVPGSDGSWQFVCQF
ncbi:glycosyl hydrolase family 18 protein [Pseudoalteromonas sp. Of7M-16]|uniref:glycosyl hydrolase family 18 protein n=1 Tax=Pseudoalteromonas sp. Of7M-16 TaxID=2917756 RepID=UPI001EF5CD87|nr:glycosyl hydrolase family 18 protein [Pseudoalteromonas sp. Of7M-16]MCG7550998.1 glycosyl hydrolase family 18 protein [Pseudoalteromonas sp. Of7M-16]